MNIHDNKCQICGNRFKCDITCCVGSPKTTAVHRCIGDTALDICKKCDKTNKNVFKVLDAYVKKSTSLSRSHTPSHSK